MLPESGKVIRRTDAELFVEARAALDQQPTVPETVRVHVDHGMATLTGTVRVVAESAEAEEVVRRVPGIERVLNDTRHQGLGPLLYPRRPLTNRGRVDASAV